MVYAFSECRTFEKNQSKKSARNYAVAAVGSEPGRSLAAARASAGEQSRDHPYGDQQRREWRELSGGELHAPSSDRYSGVRRYDQFLPAREQCDHADER